MQKSYEACHQIDFDFVFPSEPHVFVECCDVKGQGLRRPTASDGKGHRKKRKTEPNPLIGHSRGSGSTHCGTRSAATGRANGSQSVLAFGSPHHSPQPSSAVVASMSATQQQHASCSSSPLLIQTPNSRKWKKIGGFFRFRSGSNKQPHLYRIEGTGTEAKRLRSLKPRGCWRDAELPALPQDVSDSSSSDCEDSPIAKTDHRCATSTVESTKAFETTKKAPSLKLDIPRALLNQHGVMFSEAHGVRRPSLQFRRSRTVEQLSTNSTKQQKTDNLVVPQLTRPATSPTPEKSGHGLTATSSQPCLASKYSLFPTTPSSFRSKCSTPSPDQSRTRLVTVPARPPPLYQVTLSDPSGPTHDGTACQAVHTTPALSSRNEIFFDVISFRDSRGIAGQQFEMTRPPSEAVQLARSKSSARKLLQDQILSTRQTDELRCDDDERTSKSTSTQIDETIAIVESLTSLSSASASISEPSKPPVSPPLQVRTTEVITPKTDHTVLSAPVCTITTSMSGRMIPAHVNHVASRASPSIRPTLLPAFTPVTVEAVVSDESSSSPPPVPIKDSRFIPLSKYAPKQTTENLARQTGLRSVRTTRSNTDNLASYISRTSSSGRSRGPERSSTVPACLRHIPRPKHTLSPPVIAGPSSTRGGSKDKPTMIAYIKPAAEISVARKISLSRQPSTKVTMPKHITTTTARTTHLQSKQHTTSHTAPTILLTRAESKINVEQSALRGHVKLEKEINERKIQVEKKSPVVQEVNCRHKPGQSMDIILDTASTASGSPAPLVPRRDCRDFVDGGFGNISLAIPVR